MSNISSTSELTTKEIVEQAIQDYHESILPYLNGQVPTIANKFSKSDLMSYDEKIVGCAPDGKPKYQKTVTATFGSSVDAEFYRATVNHNISDMDKIYKIDYVVSVGDFGTSDYNGYYSGGIISGNTTGTPNISSGIGCWCNKTKVQVLSNFSGVASKSVEITLQYTKTTDEAIAIGSDTDYSLEEKIVGTDIDGKYIYKKTINVSFTPITEASDKYAYYTDLNVGISDIANIIKCEGRNTTNGMAMNYFAIPSSTVNCINLRSVNVLWQVDRLTLWYTKTTD